MTPLRLLCAAALLLGLAACESTSPTASSGYFGDAAVPGDDALFDVVARNALVSSVSAGTGQPRGLLICPRRDQATDLTALAAASLGARGDDKAGRDFTRALNTNAYRTLLDNDMDRAARDVALVRAHADRGAWLALSPNGAIEAMGALLPAWQILRQSDAATEADRRAVSLWLTRLAQLADRSTSRNNVAVYRGANDMMVGLMTGDRARYRRGVAEGYMSQLATMRADGSLPAETSRGVEAMARTARAISLMVYSAEIAASQGEDLYGTEVNGASLHKAIGFFLAADADVALIDRYARQNEGGKPYAPGRQDDAFGVMTLSWAFLYVRRFPDRPEARALSERLTFPGRFGHDTVGGVVTCYAGPIKEGGRSRQRAAARQIAAEQKAMAAAAARAAQPN